MVEGQPAHQPVGRRHLHRLDHHPDGGHHVPVAQHDAAGHGGAAGGVLEEADLVLGGPDRRRHRAPGLEHVRRQEMPEVRRPGARGLDVGAEPVDRDDRPGLAAPEDPGLQLGVEGGVEGHRHGADREGAEEREEELLARREDDRHLVAGPEAPLAERPGVAQARRVEPRGRQRGAEEREVDALRLGRAPGAGSAPARVGASAGRQGGDTVVPDSRGRVIYEANSSIRPGPRPAPSGGQAARDPDRRGGSMSRRSGGVASRSRHSTQSATKTLNSRAAAAPRLEQKTRRRPSGENIGNAANDSV